MIEWQGDAFFLRRRRAGGAAAPPLVGANQLYRVKNWVQSGGCGCGARSVCRWGAHRAEGRHRASMAARAPGPRLQTLLRCLELLECAGWGSVLAHCPKAAMRLRFLAAGACTWRWAPPPPSSWSAASMARGRRIRPSSCAACRWQQAARAQVRSEWQDKMAIPTSGGIEATSGACASQLLHSRRHRPGGRCPVVEAAGAALAPAAPQSPPAPSHSSTHLLQEWEAGLLRLEARLVGGTQRVQRRVRPLAVLLQRVRPVHAERAVRRPRLLLRRARRRLRLLHGAVRAAVRARRRLRQGNRDRAG